MDAGQGRRRRSDEGPGRDVGIAEDACCEWTAKYGGISVSEARRLREERVGSRGLKATVSGLASGTQTLRKPLSKRS